MNDSINKLCNLFIKKLFILSTKKRNFYLFILLRKVHLTIVDYSLIFFERESFFMRNSLQHIDSYIYIFFFIIILIKLLNFKSNY